MPEKSRLNLNMTQEMENIYIFIFYFYFYFCRTVKMAEVIGIGMEQCDADSVPKGLEETAVDSLDARSLGIGR